MASKKQRASSTGRAGGSASQPPGQGPSVRANAMLGTLRLVALMSATIVALLVFEFLQNSLSFWPALGIAFVAGIVARAAFIWLERVWLGAAARRAQRLEAKRNEQSQAPDKKADR